MHTLHHRWAKGGEFAYAVVLRTVILLTVYLTFRNPAFESRLAKLASLGDESSYECSDEVFLATSTTTTTTSTTTTTVTPIPTTNPLSSGSEAIAVFRSSVELIGGGSNCSRYVPGIF